MMTIMTNTSDFIAILLQKLVTKQKTWWCNLKIDEKQKVYKKVMKETKKTLHEHKDHCNDHNDNVNISQQKAW